MIFNLHLKIEAIDTSGMTPQYFLKKNNPTQRFFFPLSYRKEKSL